MRSQGLPNLYIIAGPNGAGKTTSAFSLLPNLLHCQEYVNADAIAAGLSPFNVETTAIQADRLMLERIHSLAEKKLDFAFETTLASRTFAPFLKNCRDNGYKVTIFFIWLEHPLLVLKRIAERVLKGGHNIPKDTAIRRYYRGIDNFLNIYTSLADEWILYDNSNESPHEIAYYNDNRLEISDHNNWLRFSEVNYEKFKS